jgi:tryptophan halogenase
MLRLLPTPEARGVDERLVREFNRLSDGLYERIRDFLILHYTANRRFGEPLWDHVRDYELPPSLHHKLKLFDSRGHVPYFKDGFFSRDSWLAVLFGQGLMPGAYDRLADFMPAELLDARLRELHARVAAHVKAMPSHAAIVERHCRQSWLTQQVAS